jgi:hypothetical protein
MDNLDTNQIQCVYDELLSIKDSLNHYVNKEWVTEDKFWNKYNSKVKKLRELTEVDLSDYFLDVKYKPNHTRRGLVDLTYSGNYIETSVFNLQLNSLLAWLENSYISKKHVKKMKEQPANNTNSFTFNQHLSQSQNVSMQVSIRDFESIIDKNRKKYSEESKETKFLDKVKSGLKTVKDIKGIVLLVSEVAKSVGLSLEDIRRIIG